MDIAWILFNDVQGCSNRKFQYFKVGAPLLWHHVASRSGQHWEALLKGCICM